MNSNPVNLALIVVGILAIVFFAGADVIGVGGAPGFGWKQISGTVIGVLLLGAGLFRLRSRR